MGYPAFSDSDERARNNTGWRRGISYVYFLRVEPGRGQWFGPCPVHACKQSRI